jgi:hypothetical protein
MDITLYGMYSVEVSGAISRMDLESVMLAASATLSCVFAVMQILHARRRPETAPAMSVTMLAVLALGQLAPLALGFEVLFVSRRSRYSLYPTEGGWLDLNQAMVRVPELIAFLLHLRLLQLVLFGRLRSAGHRSAPDAAAPSTAAVSERIVLQVCLPLYLLGGVLAAIVHVVNAGAASGGSPATLDVVRRADTGRLPAPSDHPQRVRARVQIYSGGLAVVLRGGHRAPSGTSRV